MSGTPFVRADPGSPSASGVSGTSGILNPKALRLPGAGAGVAPVGSAALPGCGVRVRAAVGDPPTWSRKPHLTRYERRAVEMVLMAAGYRESPQDPGRWHGGPGRDDIDLCELFSTPFSAIESETAE